MPLNARGKKLKKKFEEQYGKKKGQSVFYAMENSGKLKKVLKARGGMDASKDDFGGSKSSTGGNGRDPSAQYKNKTPLSASAREALGKQRQQARARISPSTTPKGKAISTAIGFGIGIPFVGGKIGSKFVDYTMGFQGPGGKKEKKKTFGGDGDQQQIKPLTVEANKPIDTSLIKPKDNFFNFVTFNMGGLSGGVRSGPPPKRGPQPQGMKKGGYKK